LTALDEVVGAQRMLAVITNLLANGIHEAGRVAIAIDVRLVVGVEAIQIPIVVGGDEPSHPIGTKRELAEGHAEGRQLAVALGLGEDEIALAVAETRRAENDGVRIAEVSAHLDEVDQSAVLDVAFQNVLDPQTGDGANAAVRVKLGMRRYGGPDED